MEAVNSAGNTGSDGGHQEEVAEAAMEAVIRAAMEAVIWAAMEAVIRAAMEEAAEAAMEEAEAAMERAAIEEGTGIQSKSGNESASENVGIQDSHRIHDCLREAETRESQLQLGELVLEIFVNSVELVEQLLKCFVLQAPVCEETTKDNKEKKED